MRAEWGHVDGVVHSIGFAPADCLGDEIFKAKWDDVSTAIQVSTYSLKALAEGFLPLMQAAGGGCVVGLDFDATKAFPMYNWMGVAKAALESLSRYLARDLGPSKVRCNLVAAGPLRTMAAKSIPGFDQFEDIWIERAPLGWDLNDTEPAAKAVVRAPERLVPRHHRRDHPRRRRLPRRRRCERLRGQAYLDSAIAFRRLRVWVMPSRLVLPRAQPSSAQ